MRKMVVKPAALAALLFGAALAFGQQPAPPAALKTDQGKEQPTKSKLEEMLEKALHDNPDVRLAAAKLAEAEAELTRARLQVVQKVAAAYQAVEAQKAAVESAQAEWAEVQEAVKSGKAPVSDGRAAQQKLIEAKAKLVDLESQLPYLLGQQPAELDVKIERGFEGVTIRSTYAEMLRRYYLDLYGRLPTKEEVAAGTLPKPAVEGPAADRIRAALDKPFTSDGKEKSVAELIDAVSKGFEEANPGLLIKTGVTPAGPVSVRFDHMPFGAVLEWIEDCDPTYRVVVRDYGLVISADGQAPSGAPRLHDFWKGAKAEDKYADKESPPSPSDRIEGLVKAIDKDLVTVNIGSDAGLAKNQILHVFRLPTAKDATAKYLGKIRVEEVNPTEAVARLESDFQSLPKPGDRVASKVSDK